MLQLYPDAELRESHTIDVLMGRLRKNSGTISQEVITTVRGRGGLFVRIALMKNYCVFFPLSLRVRFLLAAWLLRWYWCFRLPTEWSR